MFAYSFTPEKSLPGGVGFLLFGPAHLGMLGGLAALSVLVIVLALKLGERGRVILLRAMAISMVGMELIKDGALLWAGGFTLGYLPLHLCSISMFLCLWWSVRPRGDGTLVYSICLCSGLAALLFPDWTKFPILHIQSLHSFLYHAMLVQVPMIGVLSGMMRPKLRYLWKPMIFLAVLALPIWGINRLLGTNFMFLQKPLPGTPLGWSQTLLGRWYLLGYGLLAAAVLAVSMVPVIFLARNRLDDV